MHDPEPGSDTGRVASGGGTGGSRSVTTQANATLATVGAMVAAFTLFTIAAVFSLNWTEFGITSDQVVQGLSFRLPDNFKPRRVIVEIKPNNKKLPEVKEHFDWVVAG